MRTKWIWGIGLTTLLALGALMWRQWPQQGRADAFAQDRVPAVAHQVPFDSARALKDIAAICAIGTRVSGSPGMQKQQEMLEKHFKAQGLEVSFQKFQATRKSTRTTVEMANLVARINPEKTSRVVICTHYDTRPRADQETDRAKRDAPFLSANDGASGVAFLMELARHAKAVKCVHGIDLARRPFQLGPWLDLDASGDGILGFLAGATYRVGAEHRRPRLEDVLLGLDEDGVHAASHQASDLLGEQLLGALGCQRAHRLHQLATGTDIAEDEEGEWSPWSCRHERIDRWVGGVEAC